LVFIDAPEGFIAPRLANCAVENDVDNGKVVAIVSALALKNSTVIVAGEDESLTSTTLAKALATGKDKIGDSKAIVVGSKETQKTLADLATASGVALEFIDNPI
jgi:predicted ABC-class ATPase